MNKKDLITKFSKKLNISKRESELYLNTFLKCIKEGIDEDKEAKLVGFGSFKVKGRQPRTGRNPRTREEIKIPASNAVVFKAGKDLKGLINK